MRVKPIMPLGLATLLLAIGAGGVGDPREGASAPAAMAQLGGPVTVQEGGPGAFGLPLPRLSVDDRRAFSVGNALFRDNWIIAPASAEGRDGLGPLFNANSCSACHQDDGRGRPPLAAGEVGLGMVVFVSPRDADGAPHPAYGKQFQDQAIPGVAAEVCITLQPEVVRGAYADGQPWELIRWRPSFQAPAYGPLGDVRTSVRIGPQVIGGGLLEAVTDESMLQREDADDRDGDGISGRASRVSGSGPSRLGRFGWKASQPTLEDQVLAALHEDIGITSGRHSRESLTDTQRTAITAPSGGEPEIDQQRISRLTHYCRTLAVPAQRDAGTPIVERGRALFAQAGCTGCHAPTLTTGLTSPVQALRGVTFHPYTDLLLHDMGEGLADDRRDGDASGREWRTPPLWGIGLVETVNGHTRFLHDGRARGLDEAVLWHAGEAQRARDAFVNMSSPDRAALLAFLRSL